MKLTIATSQIPVSPDINKNKNTILRQMQDAKSHWCDVIHFPECALSGYVGVDMDSLDHINWTLLKESVEQIMEWAHHLGMWVILGSTHPLSEGNKPHNSLYMINNYGELIDRYDKMFCAGQSATTGELAHFSSGNHFSLFTINGIRCGTAICHEYRYPELYRELKKRSAQVVFHSFHAGNMDLEKQTRMEAEVGEEYVSINPGKTLPEITMPATMISYAANNYLWISCSNTSAKESCWGAFMVRPDGVIVGKSTKNEESILVTEIDTEVEYYDSTKCWRERAMEGVFFSGELIQDIRSELRNQL